MKRDNRQLSLFGEPVPEPLPQPEEHEREETGPPLWSRPVVPPSAPEAPVSIPEPAEPPSRRAVYIPSYREGLLEQVIRDTQSLEDENLDRDVCDLPGCDCGFSWERFYEGRIAQYLDEIHRIDAEERERNQTQG